MGRNEAGEVVTQLGQRLLAQRLGGAAAESGALGTEGGEKRGVHKHSITTVLLDTQLKMPAMNDNPKALAALKSHYHRLRRSLTRIGYISQGSVQQRSAAASGRSGYQWTRKAAHKTISVALSEPQFEAMQAAVNNERKLWKIVQEMERVSRRIISTPFRGK